MSLEGDVGKSKISSSILSIVGAGAAYLILNIFSPSTALASETAARKVNGVPVCSFVSKDLNQDLLNYLNGLAFDPSKNGNQTIREAVTLFANKFYAKQSDRDAFLNGYGNTPGAFGYLTDVIGVDIDKKIDDLVNTPCSVPLVTPVEPFTAARVPPKYVPALNPDAVDHDGDGYTLAGGDCNDNNKKINPKAEEILGNNIDENCDGADGFVVPAAEGCTAANTTQYRGSQDYTSLRKDLLDGYVPRSSAKPDKGKPATTESDVVKTLEKYGAKKDSKGNWVNNKNTKLHVEEKSYNVPGGDHKVIYIRVGEGCFSDEGDLVARVKVDNQHRVIDVNWGRKGDFEGKHWVHWGAGNPFVATYASIGAGKNGPAIETTLEVLMWGAIGYEGATLLGGAGSSGAGATGGGATGGGQPWVPY